MMIKLCFFLILGLVQNTATGAMPDTRLPGGYLATIIQSRSTNSSGYKVLIRKDGSATAEIESTPPRTQTFPPGTIDVQMLTHMLQTVGEVSAIPIGFCAKSVSFGTSTEISYNGKTSGDLQCIGRDGSNNPSNQPDQKLRDCVMEILGKLRINTHRVLTVR